MDRFYDGYSYRVDMEAKMGEKHVSINQQPAILRCSYYP